MSRSTLKPKGPAQIAKLALDLSGIVKILPPIGVVQNKYQVEGNENADIHGYSGGKKPTVWHMNKVKENVAAMNAMEQGTVTSSPTANAPAAGYHSNLGQPSHKKTTTPGNTKMQGLRAKGESILKKAKDEGRMLSRNEQLRLKSIQSRRVKEYKKNK